MVLFGELVIPSSRVLWDDETDFEQFTNESESIEWQEHTVVPNDINNLLIIETKKLSHLGRSCLIDNCEPICSLPLPAVCIYKLKDNNYLVLCEEGEDVIAGEVTEKLASWLENSKKIIAITSNSAAIFQKNSSEELPVCFIRSLVTGNVDDVHAKRLEAPNLVTGISAGVLSYCQHFGKSATIYVCYTDSRPLDSTTASPILILLQRLNIPTDKSFKFKPMFKADSNLYM